LLPGFAPFGAHRFSIFICLYLFSQFFSLNPFRSVCQLWVGVLIQTQPFFIAGIEDASEARTSAFGAMGMFLFTFVASLFGIWYDSQYKPEPIEGDEAEYHLSSDHVQSYGTST